MKDDADPCTACERLASIEAMLDTLAERITRRDQGTTGQPADNPKPQEEFIMQNNKRPWTYDSSEEVKTIVGMYFIAGGSSSPLFGCIIGQPIPGYYLATFHCGGLSELERADAHSLVQPQEMGEWHFFRDPADYKDALKTRAGLSA